MSPCPRIADIAVYYLTHLTDHWQRQKIAELDRLFPGRLGVVVPTAPRLPLPLSRGSRLVLADANSWPGTYELSHVRNASSRGCNERHRVQASCGDCGPGWGLDKCQDLCDRHATCKHIVFFSDGRCRMHIILALRTLESQPQYGGTPLGGCLGSLWSTWVSVRRARIHH